MLIMTPKNTKNSPNSLMKRARSKYIARGLSYHLVTGASKSPLKKGYLRTFGCANAILLSEGKLISHYCKHRWCPVCSRIRTEQAINGYKPQLEQLEDPYFVTLTTRTVLKGGISKRMDEMKKVWRSVTSGAQYRKLLGFKGVRSLECTSRPNNHYHPHFHVIIQGRENAEWLVEQWLKRFKGRSQRVARDIRKADAQSYKELFKYATKLSVMQGKLIDFKVPAAALDAIFRALKGRRLFQPFGGLRRDPEELEGELFGQVATEALKDKKWEWLEQDWVGSSTGELLTGHVAEGKLKGLWESGETNALLFPS